MKRAWQFLLDNLDAKNNLMLLRKYNKVVGELLFKNNGEIRNIIENNIGVFQIPIEKLEQFKTLLIEFYETADDTKIINFMTEFCIKKYINKSKIVLGQTTVQAL